MPTINPSPIKLDCSKSLIVIHCTEHDWWKASKFHKDEAWDSACAHEEAEHPGDYRQRDAREHRQRRARHAVNS
ncbi:hypothetical protein [Leifsonia aquatica]|uniref:hypothetical protein n=1 Tax=Leifsonia aquatica TaxID=144185 RepID=UPI0028A90C49|nr:hypothetical protein [Leifsonia aquatica]